jgi:hypothetical protein
VDPGSGEAAASGTFQAYGFDRFQKDWGSGSEYGQIRNYKFVLSRSWDNGVLMGVNINTGKRPFSPEDPGPLAARPPQQSRGISFLD